MQIQTKQHGVLEYRSVGVLEAKTEYPISNKECPIIKLKRRKDKTKKEKPRNTRNTRKGLEMNKDGLSVVLSNTLSELYALRAGSHYSITPVFNSIIYNFNSVAAGLVPAFKISKVSIKELNHAY